MKERDELVAELHKIQDQEKELHKQIDALDYDYRFEKAKKYEGKYFQQSNGHDGEYVRCLFVYSIDKEDCEPKTICISYWKGQDAHFEIQYYSHFNPERWQDDDDKWKEISKKEFEHHYNETLRKIERSIATKNNIA